MNLDFNKIFQSKAFSGFLCALAVFIVILIVFRAGMSVGFKKADFSYRMGDNYHRNFAGPRRGFEFGFGEMDFVESHGTIGQIIKLDGQSIIIRGRDNLEKIIIVDNKTIINYFRDSINLNDLKIDNLIVVIGEPNSSGQIIAKLIRVLPPTPAGQPGPMPGVPVLGVPAASTK
jgi:hypothetical protein